MFDFKHIRPFDKNLIKAPYPMVLFATPGMLHGGLSLQVFKEWVSNEKNTLIIPGYCVAGTLGNKLLSGVKSIVIDKKSYDIKMQIRNMSFSAHADARGILNLIRHTEPKNVMLVHGEKKKMDVLSKIIEEQFDLKCYYPANFETSVIKCNPVDLQLSVIAKADQAPWKKGALILDETSSSLMFFDKRMIEEDFEHTLKLIQEDEAILELRHFSPEQGFFCYLNDLLKRQMAQIPKESQERAMATEVNLQILEYIQKYDTIWLIELP